MQHIQATVELLDDIYADAKAHKGCHAIFGSILSSEDFLGKAVKRDDILAFALKHFDTSKDGIKRGWGASTISANIHLSAVNDGNRVTKGVNWEARKCDHSTPESRNYDRIIRCNEDKTPNPAGDYVTLYFPPKHGVYSIMEDGERATHDSGFVVVDPNGVAIPFDESANRKKSGKGKGRNTIDREAIRAANAQRRLAKYSDRALKVYAEGFNLKVTKQTTREQLVEMLLPYF